jgi:hypothetical protein
MGTLLGFEVYGEELGVTMLKDAKEILNRCCWCSDTTSWSGAWKAGGNPQRHRQESLSGAIGRNFPGGVLEMFGEKMGAA